VSKLTRLKVPVFLAEGKPRINFETWRLRVEGLVEEPRTFSLAEIKALPFSRVDARLTSVSGWSVRAGWEGVLFTDFLKLFWNRETPLVEPSGRGVSRFPSHVTFSSVGGYESTVALSDLIHPRVLLCYAIEGEPLEIEYGAPVRMIIPNLWGYKSVSCLGRIEFGGEMKGGFWEDRGYTREAAIEQGYTLDINTRQHRQIKGGEIVEF
jgi:DMSO/TMAO reductase YedYZ molybdopterin-dependent catalytic subunit